MDRAVPMTWNGHCQPPMQVTDITAVFLSGKVP